MLIRLLMVSMILLNQLNGKPIFTDTTYSHVITWLNNSSEVNNFGLTKNDVDLLATIIKEAAWKNGEIDVVNSMNGVIDGKIPYEIRAEILFRMKMPGKDGSRRTVRVHGNNSIETYTFLAYNNNTGNHHSWLYDYLTFREIKSFSYTDNNDYQLGYSRHYYNLDHIACALYEKDEEYVFSNGVYQCSCDLYKLKYGSGLYYSLDNNNAICINAPSKDKNEVQLHQFCLPGRCGIPVTRNGKTYYVTPQQTYPNLDGKEVTIAEDISYSDGVSGNIYHGDTLKVLSTDATTPTIYEGWDYVTNNMPALYVVAYDIDTKSIITLNDNTYSKFAYLSAGTHTEVAWEIEGYGYEGYITKDGCGEPSSQDLKSAPDGKTKTVTIELDSENNRKTIVYFYKKVNQQQTLVSIYKLKADNSCEIMHTGMYTAKDDVLNIWLKNNVREISYNSGEGYVISVENLENVLGISDEECEYDGGLIKKDSSCFLGYWPGEELTYKTKFSYNIRDTKQDYVHVIIVYKAIEEKPKLKISYLDEEGNAIPNMNSVETDRNINEEIVSYAEDLRDEKYMYVGYACKDTYDEFGKFSTPLEISGEENNVPTKFTESNQRRHIAFIYKKVDLKIISVDVQMEVEDLPNQLIDQEESEDYWVLDEKGTLKLHIGADGMEGLNITNNYSITLRIPFDTYIDDNFKAEGEIKLDDVSDISDITITIDDVLVPIWVEEKEYDIDVVIEANVEGFGVVSAVARDDVEVVGRLYDFTVTNIDGSELTGDSVWKKAIFSNNEEYKAKSLPVGQKNEAVEKYNYGVKLGTSFYYSINTKGEKNSGISITPKFVYVSKNGEAVEAVDVYNINNDNRKWSNILSGDSIKSFMSMKDENVSKSNIIEELKKAQVINKISYTSKVSIGSLAKINIPKNLSLPYVDYAEEIKNISGYGNISKSENELLKYASHWYGKYVVPASSIIVKQGSTNLNSSYKDGYLVVLFNIISLDKKGGEYLSYNLPASKTQWQREQLNQLIILPNGKEVVINSMKDGYAPVIVYDISLSTKDNITSAGTH